MRVTSSMQWQSSWLMLLRLKDGYMFDPMACLSGVHFLTGVTTVDCIETLCEGSTHSWCCSMETWAGRRKRAKHIARLLVTTTRLVVPISPPGSLHLPHNSFQYGALPSLAASLPLATG
jgi:hypothetical protein